MRITRIYQASIGLLLLICTGNICLADSEPHGGEIDQALLIETLNEAKAVRVEIDGIDEDTAEKNNLLLHFQELIQSVGSSFQEVTTTSGALSQEALDERPLPLTRVELSSLPTGVNAFRFKAPEEASTYEMQWVFAVPHVHFGWYIIPAEGEMEGFSNFYPRTDTDLGIEGLPAHNYFIQQSLRGGKIKGGQEYIVWFSFPKDQDFNAWVWVDLTPSD